MAQRKKEIGIRKVLGANVSRIIMLIAKDFIILVIVATIIASPIAWFTAQNWLQAFAYRINISYWVFILAGVVSLIIAGITVCAQALRAATVNPIYTLRNE